MNLETNKIYEGDVIEVLKTFPDESIDCIVTSPPYYGLRDYGVAGQIGLEPTLQEYLSKMIAVTAELKRVLKSTGTLWWDHGDSYGGSSNGAGDTTSTNRSKPESYKQMYKGQKPGKQQGIPDKCLLLQAHRLAIRMIDEQCWILRNTIIWEKPNAMPSSVKDRFSVNYEPLFFFSKSKKYYFEPQYEDYAPSSDVRYRQALRANKEYDTKALYRSNTPYANYKRGQGTVKARQNVDPTNILVVGGNNIGRNKRCVWKIPTQPYPEAHFAVFPKALVETPIKAGCPPNGIVLDPFAGSGTTLEVARTLGRQYIGIELSKEYIKLAEKRFSQIKLL